MTLALVRHGRTDWNRERRLQGQSDITLDTIGEAQARAAGSVLATAVWARVVTSPLRRAVQSAEIIRRHLGSVEYHVDPRLVERNYGEADGLPVADAWERWPDQNYPGAEPLAAVSMRASQALYALEQEEGDTVVVAHGTLLRAGIEALTEQRCPRILNGEIVLLERGARQGFTARRLVG